MEATLRDCVGFRELGSSTYKASGIARKPMLQLVVPAAKPTRLRSSHVGISSMRGRGRHPQHAVHKTIRDASCQAFHNP